MDAKHKALPGKTDMRSGEKPWSRPKPFASLAHLNDGSFLPGHQVEQSSEKTESYSDTYTEIDIDALLHRLKVPLTTHPEMQISVQHNGSLIRMLEHCQGLATENTELRMRLSALQHDNHEPENSLHLPAFQGKSNAPHCDSCTCAPRSKSDMRLWTDNAKSMYYRRQRSLSLAETTIFRIKLHIRS